MRSQTDLGTILVAVLALVVVALLVCVLVALVASALSALQLERELERMRAAGVTLVRL